MYVKQIDAALPKRSSSRAAWRKSRGESGLLFPRQFPTAGSKARATAGLMVEVDDQPLEVPASGCCRETRVWGSKE